MNRTLPELRAELVAERERLRAVELAELELAVPATPMPRRSLAAANVERARARLRRIAQVMDAHGWDE